MYFDIEASPPKSGRREKGWGIRFIHRKWGKGMRWIEETVKV
jgi:hypothetical protein